MLIVSDVGCKKSPVGAFPACGLWAESKPHAVGTGGTDYLWWSQWLYLIKKLGSVIARTAGFAPCSVRLSLDHGHWSLTPIGIFRARRRREPPSLSASAWTVSEVFPELRSIPHRSHLVWLRAGKRWLLDQHCKPPSRGCVSCGCIIHVWAGALKPAEAAIVTGFVGYRCSGRWYLPSHFPLIQLTNG